MDAPLATLEPKAQPQGTWRIQVIVWAVMVALVVLLQAIVSSNDDDPGYIPSDEELVAAHLHYEIPEATPAAARCLVAELTDEWSPADKRALVAGDWEYGPYEVGPLRYTTAAERCGVPVTHRGKDSGSSSGSPGRPL